MSLLRRQRRILAAIEHDLQEGQARVAVVVMRRFPLSARHTCLLILALVALVIMSPPLLQLGVAGLAILTGALIVPWIGSTSRAAER